MIDVLRYMDEREEEFEQHLLLARMLEARVSQAGDGSTIQIEVRHVNTIKSGLLIHLYNIVEAVMTRTLTTVGQSVVAEKPGIWTDVVLSEWVRAEVWGNHERIGDGSLKRLTNISGALASGKYLPAFVVKGEPGSWNDRSIKKVAERLGCELVLTEEIKRSAYEAIYRNETTALTYLSQRRNAIAHGESTFEDGANDLTLDELQSLSTRVLPYLRAVSRSFQTFLETKRYLKDREVVT